MRKIRVTDPESGKKVDISYEGDPPSAGEIRKILQAQHPVKVKNAGGFGDLKRLDSQQQAGRGAKDSLGSGASDALGIPGTTPIRPADLGRENRQAMAQAQRLRNAVDAEKLRRNPNLPNRGKYAPTALDNFIVSAMARPGAYVTAIANGSLTGTPEEKRWAQKVATEQYLYNSQPTRKAGAGAYGRGIADSVPEAVVGLPAPLAVGGTATVLSGGNPFVGLGAGLLTAVGQTPIVRNITKGLDRYVLGDNFVTANEQLEAEDRAAHPYLRKAGELTGQFSVFKPSAKEPVDAAKFVWNAAKAATRPGGLAALQAETETAARLAGMANPAKAFAQSGAHAIGTGVGAVMPASAEIERQKAEIAAGTRKDFDYGLIAMSVGGGVAASTPNKFGESIMAPAHALGQNFGSYLKRNVSFSDPPPKPGEVIIGSMLAGGLPLQPGMIPGIPRLSINPRTGARARGKIGNDRDVMVPEEWMHPDKPGQVRPILPFVVDRSMSDNYPPLYPDSKIKVYSPGGPLFAGEDPYYDTTGYAVDDWAKAKQIGNKIKEADTDPLGLFALGDEDMVRGQRLFFDTYLQEIAEEAERSGRKKIADKSVQKAVSYMRQVAEREQSSDPFKWTKNPPASIEDLREALKKGHLSTFPTRRLMANLLGGEKQKGLMNGLVLVPVTKVQDRFITYKGVPNGRVVAASLMDRNNTGPKAGYQLETPPIESFEFQSPGTFQGRVPGELSIYELYRELLERKYPDVKTDPQRAKVLSDQVVPLAQPNSEILRRSGVFGSVRLPDRL